MSCAAASISLIADVGATNARFALFDGEGFQRVRVLACKDYSSIQDAIGAYLNDALQPGDVGRAKAAALAVAGPVADDQVTLTNHPWSFSKNELRGHLAMDRLLVVNDFTAVAAATPYLASNERVQVGGGAPLAAAPIGVIGPGSGLGVGGLIPTAGGWLPLSGEGGHVTMTPRTARESELLDRLRDHLDHVSAERILSGPGLANIYKALAEMDGAAVAAHTSAQITDPAIGARDPHCREAVEMFCAMLGTIAGNLALTLGALGGIYIAGGIVPKLGTVFTESGFRQRFEDKGRLRSYLARIPTYVITHPFPAFLGLSKLLADLQMVEKKPTIATSRGDKPAKTTAVPRKTIGLLTSGGDCAGLNAVIHAVVTRAVEGYGWRVYGIRQGTTGLLRRPLDVEELDLRNAAGNIVRLGGTILGTTNRGDPFAFPMPDGSLKDRSEELIEGVRQLGIDALIGVGGDGSFSILRRLAQKGGINLVGIPKTIDNDVGATESSVGYHTAVTVATEALDRLQPTAASHHRVMVLEVMGRDAGHIALAAGIAGGADIILIPEIPYSMPAVAAHIDKLRQGGRNFALVIVAEAVPDRTGERVRRQQAGGGTTYGGIGQILAEAIAELTGAETRVTVLGHVQRGSQPTWEDRVVASAFGIHAVDLIAEGRFDRMVAWQNRSVVDVPLGEVIERSQQVAADSALLRTARGLGISFGDGP